ncbi:MAG: histidine--tRNA ligase [Planctomycetes bacterium]|nr:histidine--tRNA ligase [Planctomycetota bacterium]
MAARTHTFQPPKGTRDFYPQDLAVRRYIESVWREVSINHGFEEIDGPTFEHLDLYTAKSGPGIVSELFSFRRAGGDVDYALRPEFTPTLARMYAAQAGALPKPTKWFSIGPFFRAERPQRGRLREHIQWNLDIIGDESVAADVEIISAAVSALQALGLSPKNIQIQISDRRVMETILLDEGISDPTHQEEVYILLDRRSKLSREEFAWEAGKIGLSKEFITHLDKTIDFVQGHHYSVALQQMFPGDAEVHHVLFELMVELESLDLSQWVQVDLGVVRGLAYYTGTVFEIHETSGEERAIAGGGRYDNLVELFGGPPTPACGFAMGDVVLRLVLEDRGLLKAAQECAPRPDAFVISAGKDEAEKQFRPLVAKLRREGLHARHSYRSTRNVGKLLGEAAKARARFAVILGDELKDGPPWRVVVKDLDSGKQENVKLDDLATMLRERQKQ